MKLHRKTAMIVAAVSIGAALSIAVPMAAEAASGTKTCGGSTPWAYQDAKGSTLTMIPAGSQKIFSIPGPGSFTREAEYSNGTGKQGGGSWSVTGATLTQYSNYCESFG